MCDCMSKMDAELKAHPTHGNTALVWNLIGPARAVVATCKRSEKVRQKPAYIMATFCPFCGEKYQDAKSEIAA